MLAIISQTVKQQRGCYLGEDGASGRIRTSDRSVRSRVLYPAELRMHRETCFTTDIDTAAEATLSSLVLAIISQTMKQQRGCYLGEYGASGRIRTSDRSVRSRVLYPAELRMHRETNFTADIDTATKAVSSKRWCIREDDSLGSPFGPLLKQRYPPWCWRLSRRP